MIRKLFILTILFWIVFSCKTNEKEMTLSGEWLSAGKGQMLYLAKGEWVDSVEVKNGKFEFNLEGLEPDEYRLWRVNNGKDEGLLVYLDSCHTYLKLEDGVEETGNYAWINCRIEGNPVGAAMWDAVLSTLRDVWSETTTRKCREVASRGDLASAFILWKFAPVCVEFMTFDELNGYMNNLPEAVKQSAVGKRMYSAMEKLLPLTKGAVAPDFTLDTPEGKPVSLSEYVKGKKVVLIDFWASFCAPCRAKNPVVLALYDKFHEKGFDVLGVSLDDDKEAWLKANKEDRLPWVHVSELKGWKGDMPKLYNFSGIPNLVLVDGSCKILATSLELHRDLNKVVESLFE